MNELITGIYILCVVGYFHELCHIGMTYLITGNLSKIYIWSYKKIPLALYVNKYYSERKFLRIIENIKILYAPFFPCIILGFILCKILGVSLIMTINLLFIIIVILPLMDTIMIFGWLYFLINKKYNFTLDTIVDNVINYNGKHI